MPGAPTAMALGPMGIKPWDYVMDGGRRASHKASHRRLERHDRVHVSMSTEAFDEHMKATTKRIGIAVDK